jgi:hypothetical protein
MFTSPSQRNHIMQAIITTYKPATNTRGSRILARCTRGSISAPYDHSLDNCANHIAAAQALVNRFVKEDQLSLSEPPRLNPWNRARAVGQLPSGSRAHVFIN